MDATSIALRALFATLEANLPAKLAALDADRVAPLLPLSTSAVQFFPHVFTGWDGSNLVPTVAVASATPRPGQPYTTGEWLVTVRLDCRFPGKAGGRDENFEAGRAFGAAVCDVVAEGDGRGRYMIGGATDGARVSVCRQRSLTVEPTLRSPTEGSVTPIARTLPEFEIQVWI